MPCAVRHETCEKLVATASRREGVYNRTGEPSVTFCGKDVVFIARDELLDKEKPRHTILRVETLDCKEVTEKMPFSSRDIKLG